jgi:hypothetical protein
VKVAKEIDATKKERRGIFKIPRNPFLDASIF